MMRVYIHLLQVIYLSLFLLNAGCTLDSDNDKWNLLLVYSVILVGQEEEKTNLNVFTFLI